MGNVTSQGLDSIFTVSMVAHCLAFLGVGYLSLSNKEDPAKRRVAMFSAFSHIALFIAYIWLLIDAGLVVRPSDTVIFPQPFFLALITWSFFSAINVGIIERLSKVHGMAFVVFQTAAAYMFWLSGREDIKGPRDALYSLAWFVFGFSAVAGGVASRLRRNKWEDYSGYTVSGLPFTMVERLLQHLSSVLYIAIFFGSALLLGLSDAIGHRLVDYSSQFIGYIIVTILTIGLSVLQYASHREVGVPNKQE